MADDVTEPSEETTANTSGDTPVTRRRMLGNAVLAGITGTAVGAVGGGFAGYAAAAEQRGGDDDTVDLITERVAELFCSRNLLQNLIDGIE